jgi:hypothetical protein
MSKETAVAKSTQRAPVQLSPEREAQIAEARARTAVAREIKAAIWGKDLHPNVLQAVVAYCRQNNLDAVRHVEVLGGKIYLTAALYDEKGAHLLHNGDVVFEEPDFINADARLEEMAKDGDEWAKEEITRRKRLRIKYNVPEQVRAAVVTRARLRSGMVAVGVNWCGNVPGGKKDPIGDAEPTKTAQTRSRRRAWVQIADIVPGYAAVIKPLQESAKSAVPVVVVDAPEQIQGSRPLSGNPDDPYAIALGAATDRGETSDGEQFQDDRDMVEND